MGAAYVEFEEFAKAMSQPMPPGIPNPDYISIDRMGDGVGVYALVRL